MRTQVLALCLATLTLTGFSQSSAVQQINKIVTADAALEPLFYLASDELMGRSPKRPEIEIAAKYISDNLKKAGVKSISGSNDYFQSFEIIFTTSPKEGSLKVNDSTFTIGNELLQLGGEDISLTAPIVYAGFGNASDLESIDVKGKIVITRFGSSDSSSTGKGFSIIRAKQSALVAKGAIAMIELFWQKDAPWEELQQHFGQERVVSKKDSIPVLILKGDLNFISSLKNTSHATLTTSGNNLKKVSAKNVIGYVEGTDAKLKDQYIVLSAHYDHIGVTAHPKTENGKTDSIFNGARDNAIGVTGVINAARYFAKYPPKRSILFILYTGEELGLVGSKYFSEHPLVPLNKMVYNLNIDNGGYNDTTIVTVVGLGRTSADDDIVKACAEYGVKPIPDPMPEQNLFDRSDNLSLAVKGVPAPTFGMGVTAFDGEIMKYYHQLADEAASMNTRYALKYVRSYVLTAKYIADNPMQPLWKKDDKYEAAWIKLFGLEK